MSCHKHIAISISILFIFLCPWVQAQAPLDVHFEHLFSLDSPLTGTFIQDSDGFFWIGTQNGLIRYDGYDLKIYRTGPNSISNDFVLALVEDRNGAIWIGTQGGGLDRYDKETNTFTNYRHDPDDPTSLSSDIIFFSSQALYIDSTGMLWAGTQGSGLNKFDPLTGTFLHYKHDPDNSQSVSDNTIQAIIEDGDGVLWIGTENGGLNKFDRKNESFTQYLHDPNNPKSIGKGWVYALLQDPDDPNILWIGTIGSGLNKLDKTTEIFTRYSHDPSVPGHLSTDEVLALCAGEAERIWIAWWRSPLGLSLFDRHTETFIGYYTNDPNDASSITTDNIFPLYKDRSGILWLGHFAGAIDIYDPIGQKFRLYQHNPQNPESVSSNFGVPYYEDREGTIWIGTTDGGLNRYERQTDTFTHYQHDPTNPRSIRHNFVSHIFEDSEGTFWLATRGGTLSIFDRKTGECTQHYQHDPDVPESIPQHDSIRIIIEDRDDPDILWFGAFLGGFFQLNKHTGAFTNYPPNPDDANSLNSNSVYHLYQDTDGIIWLSTMGGGLNRFDRTTGSFTRYTHKPDNPQSIGSNQIFEVREYTPGTLWIATVGGGLNRFDKATETFTHYTKETGFPANTILTIRQDDNGNFWMGTDEGLVRFHPDTGETRVYKQGDGLQGDVFLDQAALKTHDGELWFGGVNGVNRFDPEKLMDNPYIPPVVVTSFKQGGEEMVLGKAPERVKKIELDWQRNFFEFEFAALNYTKPEKNQYAYMLEGFDRDWYYAGTQRFGRYANLPGGTYTLRVKGSNNDGLWNEHGTSIIINVGSPFWKTWWFYTLSAVAGVGMIGFIYHTQLQARVNRLKAEQQAALHQAAEREKEAANAANKAKSEFLSNMSHELRTPLNAILGYAQILKQDKGLNTQQEKGINIIQQSGEYLLTLINDILDISRIEARKMELYPSDFHLPNFLEGIVGLIRMRAEQKNLMLQYEVLGSLPSGVHADEKRLRQVLLNLLGNAVKFTDQGEVTLHVGVVREPTVVEAHRQPSVVVGAHRDAPLRITFEISDTGIGIGPEQLEKIFLPFEQVGESHRRAAGTGLGLPISRQLVELMGSTLHVTSRPGEGSKFWFELELPVVEIEAAPEHSFERTIVGYKGQRLKALVVDDKSYNRSVLVNLLTPIGFEVAEARDGREGIERACELSPDIIFMDLVMPVMTGIEAVQELRKLPEFRETLIVSVTASVLESDLQQSKLAGCNAFLPKPVKVKQLWAVLETHLRVEWVYEEVSGTEKEEDSAAKAAGKEPLIPPPGEELEILCELAMLGDLHGLQERADHLEQMDEQFGPFARKLKQLAGTYRDRQVLVLIEGYMDIGEHS